jgi:hypothetical protein
VHPDPDSILASDADAVVLHRDLDAEERALAPDWMPLADPLPGAAERRREVPALALRLERRLGPPDHADALALAWDLSDRTGSDRGEPPQPE